METEILKAIELLKQGKTGKVSTNIFTVENAVVFRDVKESHHTTFKKVQEVIAIKTNSGVILGNSSRMQELEDQRFKKIIQPARIQKILSEHITMIPFSVFQEAGLDLLSCEIVDSGPPATLKEHDRDFSRNVMDKTIERHFTGARLFKAHSKTLFTKDEKEKLKKVKHTLTYKYFLCDVDRREVEHNIINFFLAELPEKCETISQAYDMLKPNEVKMFEENTGKEVMRQGEFFFIPTNIVSDVDQNEVNNIREIRVGNSRPNRVEKGVEYGGKLYVSGKISHTGREHADLHLPLDQWFKVVPNTSKANFQLTGDID
jgi:hypothetical protein